MVEASAYRLGEPYDDRSLVEIKLILASEKLRFRPSLVCELMNMSSTVTQRTPIKTRRAMEEMTKKMKFFRGHPRSNWGPFDLQSNALPLSYAPYGNEKYNYLEVRRTHKDKFSSWVVFGRHSDLWRLQYLYCKNQENYDSLYWTYWHIEHWTSWWRNIVTHQQFVWE